MPTPTKSVTELIEAGPTDGNSIIQEAIDSTGDDTKIPLDAFEKAKHGDSNVLPLDPKTKEMLEKEEKRAEELEKSEEKQVDDSKLAEKQDDKKVDTTKSEEVKTTLVKAEDNSDDGLIHLELAISPGQAKYFKKMDKSAAEFVKSELKTRLTKINELTQQNKELSEKAEKGAAARKGDGSDLPENWYENNDALYITPEYNNISTKLSKLEGVKAHYRRQKIAIEEGENWEDLTTDEKGRVVKQPMKPSSVAKDQVDQMLLDINNAETELKQALSAVEQNFNTGHIRSREQVVKLEDQYFPQYKDTKVLESNKHYKAITDLFTKVGLNKDRLSGVTAKMYIFTMENLAKLEAAEAKIKELETTKTTKKSSNGPTGDEINHGGGSNAPVDEEDEQVSLDSFESYKAKARGN